MLHLSVSVVVPLRNEEKTVAALLTSLQRQTLAPSEIICVDGGSTDSTCQVIRDREWGAVPVRLIVAGPALPGRGRNVGTEQAHSDWIAYIDGGVVPEADWLLELGSKLEENSEVDAVFGNFTPRTDDFFTECAACAYVKPPRLEHGEPFRGPSIFSALVRRAAWERVGGFPENLRSGEDVLFIESITRPSCSETRYVLAPGASVKWELAPSWTKTLRRFRAYSKSGIEAGTFRDWHLRMFARYAVISLSNVVPLAYGRSLWPVPLLLLAAFLLMRGSVSVWRYRDELACSPLGFIRRILGATSILVAVDAGLFSGTLDWLLSRAPGTASGPEGMASAPSTKDRSTY